MAIGLGGDSSWGACSSVSGNGGLDGAFGRLCYAWEWGVAAGSGDGREGLAADAELGVGLADLRTRDAKSKVTCVV